MIQVASPAALTKSGPRLANRPPLAYTHILLPVLLQSTCHLQRPCFYRPDEPQAPTKWRRQARTWCS